MDDASPILVVVSGLAGSGKTEVARRLSKGLGATILDKDTMSRGFVEHILEQRGHSPHDREGEFYVQTVRQLEYEQLVRTAMENLDCGISTIMTAPFVQEGRSRNWYEDMLDRVDAREARLAVVWVRCDPPGMKRYLAARNAPRDLWKRNHWDEYLELAQWDRLPTFDHHLIDNSQYEVERAPVAQVEMLIERLKP